MYKKELMKIAIADSGMTIKAISNKTGIQYETLRRKLNGRNPWYLDEVVKVALVLRLTAAERDAIFLSVD